MQCPSPLPLESDRPILLDFAEEIRQYQMRQEEPTPWPATPSPCSLVKFKCPSGSEGGGGSELRGEYSENKHKHSDCEYSESVGASIDGPSIDYVNTSHPRYPTWTLGPFIRITVKTNLSAQNQ